MSDEGLDAAGKRRRGFLGLLPGAIAFGASLLHGGKLQALDLSDKPLWHDGLKAMREAAKEQRENLAVFAGEETTGRWLGHFEGTLLGAPYSSARVARMLLDSAYPHEIQKGYVVEHTHTEKAKRLFLKAIRSGIRLPIAPAPQSILLARERAALAFLSSPAGEDVRHFAEDEVGTYLYYKNVQPGPATWGVTSAYERWTMQYLEWTDENRQRGDKYARAIQFQEQQAKSADRVRERLTTWLEQNPVLTDELIRVVLRGEWDDVTTRGRRVELLVSRLLGWTSEVDAAFRSIFQRPGGGEVFNLLSDYWRTYSAARAERERHRLVEAILRGTVGLDEAIVEYKDFLLARYGVEAERTKF